MDNGLFKRAIADTEDPTPGYMFRDIAQWTFADHSTQSKLIAALTQKLVPTTSPYQLAKVLRIIKVVCETGHVDFQKEFQRCSEKVKDFASYRGKSDPKFGDALNERVRVAAREAMDAIFSHRRPDVKSQFSVSGFGSDASAAPPSTTPSTFTTGNRISTTMGAGTLASAISAGGGDPRIAPMPSTVRTAEDASSSPNRGALHEFRRSVATGFGMWADAPKSMEERMREALTTNGEFKPVEVPGSGFAPRGESSGWKMDSMVAHDNVETVVVQTAYQREVQRLAELKSTPQRVELAAFATAVQAIGGDASELAECIDERLAQKYSWQSRLNVLTALEYLLKSDVSPAIGEYFNENPEDVQRNVHVVQASVKDRATKVLNALGIPIRSTDSRATDKAQVVHTAASGGTATWTSPVEEPRDGLSFENMSVKEAPQRAAQGKGLRKRAPIKSTAPDTANWSATPAPPPSSAWESTGWSAQGWGEATSHATDATAPPPAPTRLPAPQTDDFDQFFSSGPAGVKATPSPPPAVVAPPPPSPSPANVATPAVAREMVMAMQQQMQMLMAQAPTNPAVASQMAALLQQQQQIMALLQRQSATEPLSASAPTPHGSFMAGAGSLSRPQPPSDDSLAAVQTEMMQRLMQR